MWSLAKVLNETERMTQTASTKNVVLNFLFICDEDCAQGTVTQYMNRNEKVMPKIDLSA